MKCKSEEYLVLLGFFKQLIVLVMRIVPLMPCLFCLHKLELLKVYWTNIYKYKHSVDDFLMFPWYVNLLVAYAILL